MESSATALAIEPIQSRFNWREFWILTAAGIFGCLASLPLLLPVLRNTPAHIQQLASVPVWVLTAVRMVNMAVLVAAFVALGVALAKRCGLGAPILEAWLAGQRVGNRVGAIVKIAVPAGALASIIILALEKYFFAPRMPELANLANTIAEPAIWQGFLASFYGGITEELLLRFGVLTLLIWVLGKLSHTAEGLPSAAAFWAANLLAAVLFGLGHLPLTASLTPITTMVVTRAVVLNGLGGVVFGYLYWKRGLESAMVAHFSADIVLHVLAPAWVLWFTR